MRQGWSLPGLGHVEVSCGKNEVRQEVVPDGRSITSDGNDHKADNSPFGEGVAHEPPDCQLPEAELLYRNLVLRLSVTRTRVAKVGLGLYCALKHMKSSGRQPRTRCRPVR